MWGLRKSVSLLLDHGHPEAQSYPIGMLWDESLLVIERLNRIEVSRVMLFQAAVSAFFSKDAANELQKLVSKMMED